MLAGFCSLFRRRTALRDDFADTALQGILTGPYEHLKAIATASDSPSEAFANAAYEIADAMLKARTARHAEVES